MKIIARFTHFDAEIDLAEIQDDAILAQLLEGARAGHPVSFDVVEAIARSARAAKLAKTSGRG